MRAAAAMLRVTAYAGLLSLAQTSAAQETIPAATADPAPVEAPDKEATAPANPCIRLHTIRSTKVLDGRTILFELNGKRMMVNRLPHNCPGLKFEKRFLYKTSLSQLCSQDIITVLTDNGRGASCGLGKFEPYVPPEAVQGQPDGTALEPVKE